MHICAGCVQVVLHTRTQRNIPVLRPGDHLERSARSTPFNAMFFSLPADLLQVGESFDCHILPSGSIVPECLHTEAYFILVQVALHLFYVKIRAFLN